MILMNPSKMIELIKLATLRARDRARTEQSLVAYDCLSTLASELHKMGEEQERREVENKS